jgi:cyclopropane fatty-acyl-phospholipid synthase-like methyltransferase
MAAVSWLQQRMANRIRGERPCRLEVDSTTSSDALNGNGHSGNDHSGGISSKPRKDLDPGPQWCNLGLWNDGDHGDCDPLGGYDEACERLALALGSAAGLTTNDTVLCCGCGSGAELGLYKDRFKLRHITGIDPDFDLAAESKRSCFNGHDFNIRRMKARVEDLHQSAGADSLFPPTYFSKILALDNVYHYMSKLNFFRDCASMLPPGGKVGVTDILMVNGATPMWVRLALRIMGIPDRNLWTQDEYVKHMSNLGFVDIKIESTGRRVFLGWKHFLPKALTKHLEYAIIVATRPPLPSVKETKQKRVAIVGSGLSGPHPSTTTLSKRNEAKESGHRWIRSFWSHGSPYYCKLFQGG